MTAGPVVRSLSVLQGLIDKALKQAKEAAEKASEPYYRVAGELMLEAKMRLPHGEFRPWVQRNFGLSASHTTRILAYAKEAPAMLENDHAGSFPSMREFLRRSGRDSSRSAPEGWAEGAAIARAETDRWLAEQTAERQVALRMIDAGYKALAKELHPDKGGSDRDGMARLNRVRKRHKDFAAG